VATLTHPNGLALHAKGSADGIAELVADLLDGTSLNAALARARKAGHASPEQVRGESRDDRSDVFVLGCFLYERLTGAAPFTGATPADRRTAILQEDPVDLSDPPYRVPSAISRIVARCLEKHPDRRYQSLQDLARAMRAIDTRPARRGARLLAMAAGALLIAALALLSSRVDRGHWPWTSEPVRGVAVMPFNR
jgi:serine/threonine protein kinase